MSRSAAVVAARRASGTTGGGTMKPIMVDDAVTVSSVDAPAPAPSTARSLDLDISRQARHRMNAKKASHNVCKWCGFTCVETMCSKADGNQCDGCIGTLSYFYSYKAKGEEDIFLLCLLLLLNIISLFRT